MRNPSDRQFGLVVLLVVALCTVGITVAAFPAVTFNPTQSPSLMGDDISPVRMLLPEGFAFFTRPPREPDVHLYRKTKERWESASLGPNARPGNLFGLNRKSRAQSIEYALLLNGRGPDEWTSCETDPTKCLTRTAAQDTVANPTPHPTLCGLIGFVRQEPVPWAWSQDRSTIEMPSNVIKLHVSC